MEIVFELSLREYIPVKLLLNPLRCLRCFAVDAAEIMHAIDQLTRGERAFQNFGRVCRQLSATGLGAGSGRAQV